MSPSSLSSTLTAVVALSSRTRSNGWLLGLFVLLSASSMLADKLFKVDFHDLLDQRVHLGPVLHNLSWIQNLLSLQEVQEVSQILHDFILVAG